MKPKTREQNFLAKIAGDTNADLTMVPRTAEEYFLNQIAENGGGSSLPSYTSADKGKALTIVEGEGSVTTVIVPEQTVTFDDGVGYPTNCDPTGFVVGATGVISVNGTQYNATCADVGNALVFSSQETEIIVGYADNSVIVAGGGSLEQATISLTASVAAVEPKWEAAGGAEITYVSVGNVTASGNLANMAIYVDGVELSTYEAVHAYISQIRDKIIRISSPNGGWYSANCVEDYTSAAGNVAYIEMISVMENGLETVSIGYISRT